MVDYSVWDHIEVSDDEDETHPNIDTASLFRWRHQARVERMEQFQKEKEELDRGCRECKRKVAECQRKLKELEVAEGEGSKAELERLQAEAQQLRKEERNWEQKLEEMRKKEKSMPWNVDTLSKDGFSKSMVNAKPEQAEEESEEVREQKHKTFVEKYEKQIKHFGMLRRWDDSQKYLSDNVHLVCEETANYLVIWCIDLEVEEKCALMEQVAHQTIVMQFILELAKSLKVDPRACFRQFFTKIKTADRQYMEGFNDELEAFKERVRGRAKLRIEKALKEYEEEERKKRLGPGGLDPVEVYESLPEVCSKTPSAKWTPRTRSTTCSAASTPASGSPIPSPARPRRGRRRAPGTQTPCWKPSSQARKRMSARDSPQLPPTCLQALCTPFQKMKIDAIALVPGFLHFHCVPPILGDLPLMHPPLPSRACPSLALSQGGSLPAAPPSALCQRPRGPERGRGRQVGPGEEGGAPAEACSSQCGLWVHCLSAVEFYMETAAIFQ
ncbi:cell division cycle 37, HSP90 cochaperone [Rhinolophus ferrumequinum]|uniref:Hsp90 co-chaperone Cdc37 n=1 Tax=Rhinolophus ferrumequinum TaxID=59479 RepID=A0A7J7TZB2_RHIFE|nr:cell division cycle 37, HSP90 cochaperone [Rhinolophus ferrumequinum]